MSLQENSGVSAEVTSGDTILHVTMTQPWPVPPPARTRTWPLAILAILAVAVATAALVVSLTRSGTGSNVTYTAAQKNAAKVHLCERYRLAYDAAYTETNGSDIALARISATNAALILESAASDPALSDKYRNAALALATSYQTMTAEGSRGADDPQFKNSISDVNAKIHALEDLCGD